MGHPAPDGEPGGLPPPDAAAEASRLPHDHPALALQRADVRQPSPPETDRDHVRRRVPRCLPLRVAGHRALRDARDLVFDHRADLGGRPSFLTWKQVRRFEKRGVEIGSHTVSHASLTSLSDAGALAELIGSRKKLERKLDHRVPWLAYPYGDYDARIECSRRRPATSSPSRRTGDRFSRRSGPSPSSASASSTRLRERARRNAPRGARHEGI